MLCFMTKARLCSARKEALITDLYGQLSRTEALTAQSQIMSFLPHSLLVSLQVLLNSELGFFL